MYRCGGGNAMYISAFRRLNIPVGWNFIAFILVSYEMRRHINLRQIEAFAAVIQNGTVGRGAEMLNISQPAMSKLIAHLEFDSGLKLFDRVKKRLVPTEHALRLYDEVERIFSGVRQVESAIDALHREEQSRLAIGVLPALAGAFIQRVTSGFTKSNTNVICSVRALSSQWIVERLVARKLDIGLINGRLDNPHVLVEPLLEHPLVCIMPKDHPLTLKSSVEPDDLQQLPFVSFESHVFMAHLIEQTLEKYRVTPRVVVTASAVLTVCEFVAAGEGISLVHPLMVSGLENRLAVRPFEPGIPFKFQLGRSADSKNARLVDAFAEEMRNAASQFSLSILRSSQPD